MTETGTRPPLPPFTAETAAKKKIHAKTAEDIFLRPLRDFLSVLCVKFF